MSFLIATTIAILGGIALSMQAPLNATLAHGAGDTVFAACVSFLLGFLVLFVIVALRGAWPGTTQLAQVPWWAWMGGIFGAFYVFSLTLAVSTLGALSAIAALVFGQLIAALVLDSVGAFRLPVHEITWQRIAAMVLVLSGLVLSRF